MALKLGFLYPSAHGRSRGGEVTDFLKVTLRLISIGEHF
jgi:hypothetical protein